MPGCRRYVSRVAELLRLPGVVFTTLLLASPAAQSAACSGADAEALRWLDKMSRSNNQVSYHGVVTFQRDNDDMQVVQVAHSVAGDTTSERLTQLTGQGAEVVRKNHPLDCIHPGHKLLRLGQQLRGGQCGIADHYRRFTDE